MTATRWLDLVVSSLALFVALPLIAVAALGIKLSSPGPAFYRARRAGLGGEPFDMLKLRSMHVRERAGPEITAPEDARVFAFGGLLRKLKIDELPQFFNVLKGDMSIVGPRPESVAIVAAHYEDWMMETLGAKPGITSPGAIFGYEQGDSYLSPEDPDGSYVRRLLPVKLAIERAYLERASFSSDVLVLFRTLGSILGQMFGIRPSIRPEERARAAKWCGEDAFDI